MTLTSLTPWRKTRPFPSLFGNGDPFHALQQRINDMFEGVLTERDIVPSPALPLSGFTPTIDVIDKGEVYQIKVELPGLKQEDLTVSLENNALTIKGEKKIETEDKGRDYYRAERCYGSFCRVLPFATDIVADKIDASFKNGLLTVTLPKTPEAQRQTKKITIKTEK